MAVVANGELHEEIAMAAGAVQAFVVDASDGLSMFDGFKAFCRRQVISKAFRRF